MFEIRQRFCEQAALGTFVLSPVSHTKASDAGQSPGEAAKEKSKNMELPAAAEPQPISYITIQKTDNGFFDDVLTAYTTFQKV